MRKFTNIAEDLKVMKDEGINVFTPNAITGLNKAFNRMIPLSSEKYNYHTNYDIKTQFNYEFLTGVLSEWVLEWDDKKGYFDIEDNIRISVNKDLECQLCKSFSAKAKGKYDCGVLFKIKNVVTGEVLWVASQCIKKFKIKIIHNGHLVDDYDAYFNTIENNVITFKLENKNNKLFEFITENNLKIFTKYNASSKFIKNFVNAMKVYTNSLYSLATEEQDEMLSQIQQKVSDIWNKYYKYCRECCDKQMYTFVPSKDFVLKGNTDASGAYLVILSYITTLNSLDEFTQEHVDKLNEMLSCMNILITHKSVNPIASDLRRIPLSERNDKNNKTSKKDYKIKGVQFLGLLALYIDEYNYNNNLIKKFNKDTLIQLKEILNNEEIINNKPFNLYSEKIEPLKENVNRALKKYEPKTKPFERRDNKKKITKIDNLKFM